MKATPFFQRITDTLTSFYTWFIHRKLAIAIFIVFTLALPAYVLYVTVFMPVKTAGDLVSYDQSDLLKSDTAAIQKDISEELMQKIDAVGLLELEKAYIKNRLDLAAKSDSVYMTLNLKDSLLNLEINGVVVRSCPVKGIRVSRRLSHVDHEQILSWISTPFTLESDLSTIPKIPYVIKEAPKDTLEAQAQSAIPLPPDTTSVYFTLYFDRDLVVEIEQSEPPDDVDMVLIKGYFDTKDRAFRKEAIRAAWSGRAPRQEIYLRLQVSPADARAIYRGIPVNASLALKL